MEKGLGMRLCTLGMYYVGTYTYDYRSGRPDGTLVVIGSMCKSATKIVKCLITTRQKSHENAIRKEPNHMKC